jgi:DNA-directed RNA polymerase beta' subunit
MLKADESLTQPTNEQLLDILEKLLTEIEEPKLCISKTDTVLPSLAKLIIEAFEPILDTDLTLKLEPIDTKSNVDNDDPNLPKLLMEIAEPTHCS